MPDLQWNREFWGDTYSWGQAGDEWSQTWGSSEAQWFGTLYPRLHRALPARTILEIAPGHGRWSRYLIPHCSAYVGLDLSASCVEACRKRFATIDHALFFENDGLSLADVPDASYDLVFSFDSLVHAEINVIESYIPQIIQKLTPVGFAFIHHSNLAACDHEGSKTPHSRAASVSARRVAELVQQNGGAMLVSELIDWGPDSDLIDCFSTFTRAENATSEHLWLRNRHFMEEAANVGRFQSGYSHLKRPTVANMA